MNRTVQILLAGHLRARRRGGCLPAAFVGSLSAQYRLSSGTAIRDEEYVFELEEEDSNNAATATLAGFDAGAAAAAASVKGSTFAAAATESDMQRLTAALEGEMDDEGDEEPRDVATTEEEAVAETDLLHSGGSLPGHVVRRQQALYGCPTEDLVEQATHYLRATVNAKLVSAEEEHAIFPVLMDRLEELRVGQLLDIVESHWARSTLVRYGTAFKDTARDRIADIANAVTHRPAEKGEGEEEEGAGEGASGVDASNHNEDEDEDIFAADKAEKDALRWQDPILAAAATELDAQTVLRCIVVMGMSAGHRKRDLAFFSVLGSFFAVNINLYKDPHDLVHVLTALSRAKIVPSPSFLALLSRRFPVVSKRVPLELLPCYRAMVNFARMGHENMSTYRFFADYMLQAMEKRIAEEKVALKKKEEREEKKNGSAEEARAAPALVTQLSEADRAKLRLKELTGLTPMMVSRWLLVLARHGAPHQQYLRPLIQPVIVPMLEHFPPPSFTRLLLATRMFKSGDLELLEPVIQRLCDAGKAAGNGNGGLTVGGSRPVSFVDSIAVLSILSKPDIPVPDNMGEFLSFFHDTCVRGMPTTGSNSSDNINNSNIEGAVAFVLRPADMCTVASHLLQLQRKTEISLETLEPMTALMEAFAGRMTHLMDLRVVSLMHIDVFADICAQQQHPDASGRIEAMLAARRAISSASSADDDGLSGDEAYYSALDIDVRDTFHKILVINGSNTYGDYRPLSGPIQLDFRDWLTKVSAFDLLEAADLHERACPGALRPAPGRFLARSLLQKLGGAGEEVIDFEAHRLELRAPRELLLTREDLAAFAGLVARTPVRQVRHSQEVWTFIRDKAERLQLPEIAQTADRVLAEVVYA